MQRAQHPHPPKGPESEASQPPGRLPGFWDSACHLPQHPSLGPDTSLTVGLLGRGSWVPRAHLRAHWAPRLALDGERLEGPHSRAGTGQGQKLSRAGPHLLSEHGGFNRQAPVLSGDPKCRPGSVVPGWGSGSQRGSQVEGREERPAGWGRRGQQTAQTSTVAAARAGQGTAGLQGCTQGWAAREAARETTLSSGSGTPSPCPEGCGGWHWGQSCLCAVHIRMPWLGSSGITHWPRAHRLQALMIPLCRPLDFTAGEPGASEGSRAKSSPVSDPLHAPGEAGLLEKLVLREKLVFWEKLGSQRLSWPNFC